MLSSRRATLDANSALPADFHVVLHPREHIHQQRQCPARLRRKVGDGEHYETIVLDKRNAYMHVHNKINKNIALENK